MFSWSLYSRKTVCLGWREVKFSCGVVRTGLKATLQVQNSLKPSQVPDSVKLQDYTFQNLVLLANLFCFKQVK